MSVFASIAIICTMASCSDYYVDTAVTQTEARINTQAIDNEFMTVWGDETELKNWLKKYQIGETVFEIVSVEFETKEVKDKEIP